MWKHSSQNRSFSGRTEHEEANLLRHTTDGLRPSNSELLAPRPMKARFSPKELRNSVRGTSNSNSRETVGGIIGFSTADRHMSWSAMDLPQRESGDIQATYELLSILEGTGNVVPLPSTLISLRSSAASPSIPMMLPSPMSPPPHDDDEELDLEDDEDDGGAETGATPPHRVANPLCCNTPFQLDALGSISFAHFGGPKTLTRGKSGDANCHCCACSGSSIEKEGAELGLFALSPPPSTLLSNTTGECHTRRRRTGSSPQHARALTDTNLLVSARC